MHKKVDIILLNYRDIEDTSECVLSLLKSSYPIRRIWVIDNTEKIDYKVPDCFSATNVTYIPTGANLGFTGGCNFGLKRAAEEAPDYYLLLNNDTVVKEDFLSQLLAGAEQAGAGLATGKIYYFDRPKVFWGAGGWMDWARGTGRFYGIDAQDEGQFDQLREISFISGCLMLIRSDVLAKIGYLDDAFFMYFEDVDYGIRASRAGFKLAYVPGSVIWHKVGAKKCGVSPFHFYYFIRNSIRIMSLYGDAMKKFRFGLYAVPYFSAKIVLSPDRGKLFRSARRALKDAFFGQWGRAAGL